MVDGLAESPLTPGGAGISVDRSGKITFNRDTFKGPAPSPRTPTACVESSRRGRPPQVAPSSLPPVIGTKAGVYAVDVTTAPGVGIDAAGTIDGLPAVGNGSLLTVLATTPGAACRVSRCASRERAPARSDRSATSRGWRNASPRRVGRDESTDGSLTSSKAAQQANVDALQRSIDSFENRMTKREAALKKEYAALEVALGNLKNQGNWLSGQLSSLSVNSGG